MRAPALITASLLAGVRPRRVQPRGLTFDLGSAGGAGGAATTASSTASSGGGGSSASSSVSTGPAPAVCGNGEQEQGEECDDGNVAALDGCSPLCTTDVLDKCPGALVPLTPAGTHIKVTLQGATQDVKPSCGTDKADLIYAIVPSESGTLQASSTTTPFMGITISIRSSCADGPTSELVCSTGTSPSAKIWVHAGLTYWVVVSAESPLIPDFTLDLKLSPCGDGAVTGFEQCDDPASPTCFGCLDCTGNNEVIGPVSKHCYLLQLNGSKSWAGARSACIAWGGDLAALSTQTELDFIARK